MLVDGNLRHEFAVPKPAWIYRVGGALSRHWAALLILALLLAGLFYSVNRGGIGEFNPYTLERRALSEYTLFSDAIPLYRSAHMSYGDPLIVYLVGQGYVSPVEPANDRWELIFHWNDSWKDGYGPLYQLFRERDELIAWSEADPDRARAFWSEFFRMLRSDRDVDHEMAYAMSREWRVGKDKAQMQLLIKELRLGVLMDAQWISEVSPEERNRFREEMSSLRELQGDAPLPE